MSAVTLSHPSTPVSHSTVSPSSRSPSPFPFPSPSTSLSNHPGFLSDVIDLHLDSILGTNPLVTTCYHPSNLSSSSSIPLPPPPFSSSSSSSSFPVSDQCLDFSNYQTSSHTDHYDHDNDGDVSSLPSSAFVFPPDDSVTVDEDRSDTDQLNVQVFDDHTDITFDQVPPQVPDHFNMQANGQSDSHLLSQGRSSLDPSSHVILTQPNFTSLLPTYSDCEEGEVTDLSPFLNVSPLSDFFPSYSPSSTSSYASYHSLQEDDLDLHSDLLLNEFSAPEVPLPPGPNVSSLYDRYIRPVVSLPSCSILGTESPQSDPTFGTQHPALFARFAPISEVSTNVLGPLPFPSSLQYDGISTASPCGTDTIPDPVQHFPNESVTAAVDDLPWGETTVSETPTRPVDRRPRKPSIALSSLRPSVAPPSIMGDLISMSATDRDSVAFSSNLPNTSTSLMNRFSSLDYCQSPQLPLSPMYTSYPDGSTSLYPHPPPLQSILTSPSSITTSMAPDFVDHLSVSPIGHSTSHSLPPAMNTNTITTNLTSTLCPNNDHHSWGMSGPEFGASPHAQAPPMASIAWWAGVSPQVPFTSTPMAPHYSPSSSTYKNRQPILLDRSHRDRPSHISTKNHTQ